MCRFVSVCGFFKYTSYLHIILFRLAEFVRMLVRRRGHLNLLRRSVRYFACYIYSLGIEANAAEGALSLTLTPSGSCFRSRESCRDQPEIVEPVSGSALLASSRETEMNRETRQRIKRFLLTCNSFPYDQSYPNHSQWQL